MTGHIVNTTFIKYYAINIFECASKFSIYFNYFSYVCLVASGKMPSAS